MRMTTTKQLQSLVSKLKRELQGHMDAIAEIDSVFSQLGLASTQTKRRGRPPGSKVGRPRKAAKRMGKRRKRGKFEMSGLESVLQFVSKAGGKGASSADIVEHWKGEGRSGSAYKSINDLVKARKLKKRKVEGTRGSRYLAA